MNNDLKDNTPTILSRMIQQPTNWPELDKNILGQWFTQNVFIRCEPANKF